MYGLGFFLFLHCIVFLGSGGFGTLTENMAVWYFFFHCFTDSNFGGGGFFHWCM